MMRLLSSVGLMFVMASSAFAGYPYSMTYNPTIGEVVLGDHINTSNTEHINNNIPESIDDYSTSEVEMRSTTDPYPASAVSLATTLDGELQRIRYVIEQITQESYWYVDPPTFCENSADYDHVAYDFTTGGIIRIDVDGTGINADGSLSFGATATDSGIYWNGTNLEIDTTSAIELSISGTTEADLASDGFNIITGDSYQVNNTSVLSATTLGSSVVNSSLTSVGTLTGLTVANTDNTAYSSSSIGNMVTANNASTTSTAYSGILLSVDGVGNGSRASISAVDAGSGTTELTFNTRISSVDAERMRIDSSGNVGIGTDAPSAVLNVVDTDNTAYSSSSIGNMIIANNASTTSTAYSGLLLSVDGVGNGSRASINAIDAGSGTTELTFNTRISSVDAERMRIDGSGNVGIGTTSPGKLVDIAGGSVRVRASNSNTKSAVDQTTENTQGVTTSAVTIGTSVGSYGGLAMVYGSDSGGTAVFNDIVHVLATPAAINSGTVTGSPGSRTYTMSGSNLQLQMGSGTYDVTLVVFAGLDPR